MKDRIKDYIEVHREQMIETLVELIETPSPDREPSIAQKVVKRKLEELGYVTKTFEMDERVKQCPDYCDPGFEYPEGVCNLVGIRKGKKADKTLILYGHIDTEARDYFGDFEDPFRVSRENGRISGLGACDDKGGIAMMIEALRTAHALKGDLDQNITVLSLIGKHGGSFGTLSAMMKGYHGNDAIYIHPAETGHGFQEIKNISLGILDMKLTVYGEVGLLHDDLDPGENANIAMAKAIAVIEELNQKMRREETFDFGSFKGQSSFLLNVGSVRSSGGPGTVCEKAECLMRCRFFYPYTVDGIFDLVASALNERFEGRCLLEKGTFRAEPAMVENDDPFVRFIEGCINNIDGTEEFIHQYHGGSDIRFPILYGSSRCVGIGPYCELPEKGSGTMEWIDEEDYLKGIAILSKILIDYSTEIK